MKEQKREELKAAFKELSDSKEDIIKELLAMSEGPKFFPDDDYWFNYLIVTALEILKTDFPKLLKNLEKGETLSTEEEKPLYELNDRCIKCRNFLDKRAQLLERRIRLLEERNIKTPSIN